MRGASIYARPWLRRAAQAPPQETVEHGDVTGEMREATGGVHATARRGGEQRAARRGFFPEDRSLRKRSLQKFANIRNWEKESGQSDPAQLRGAAAHEVPRTGHATVTAAMQEAGSAREGQAAAGSSRGSRAVDSSDNDSAPESAAARESDGRLHEAIVVEMKGACAGSDPRLAAAVAALSKAIEADMGELLENASGTSDIKGRERAASVTLEWDNMRGMAGDLSNVACGVQRKEKGITGEIVHAVRMAQTAAAEARAAWKSAATVELARRAERGERGPLGQQRRIRAGGFDAWKQRVQAARVEGEHDGGTVGKGWTMAAMLIRYKERERRERAQRANTKRRPTDGGPGHTEGEGVLVMESAEVEGEHGQARAVVVGAVRVPRGASVGDARPALRRCCSALRLGTRTRRYSSGIPTGQKRMKMVAIFTSAPCLVRSLCPVLSSQMMDRSWRR